MHRSEAEGGGNRLAIDFEPTDSEYCSCDYCKGTALHGRCNRGALSVSTCGR